MFSLIFVWINDWVNNREAGDLRRYRAHYEVIVMVQDIFVTHFFADALIGIYPHLSSQYQAWPCVALVIGVLRGDELTYHARMQEKIF